MGQWLLRAVCLNSQARQELQDHWVPSGHLCAFLTSLKPALLPPLPHQSLPNVEASAAGIQNSFGFPSLFLSVPPPVSCLFPIPLPEASVSFTSEAVGGSLAACKGPEFRSRVFSHLHTQRSFLLGASYLDNGNLQRARQEKQSKTWYLSYLSGKFLAMPFFS